MDSSRVNRIVVVCNGRIGDMIVTNFAIRKIRSAFPQAEIVLVTLERNRDLLRYDTAVDRIRFYRKGLGIIPLLIALRRLKADVLLDFNDNSSTTSMQLARYGGAKNTVGFAFAKNRKYLTIPVEQPNIETTHILERRRRIPEAIGIRFGESEVVPLISIGTDEMREVSSHLKEVLPEDTFLVAVNLSAGSPGRYWLTARWQELLRTLHEGNAKMRFLFLNLPAEDHIARNTASVLPSSAVLFPRFREFHHFAAYIASANLLISPDTSAIHIASALRVPVLGLYPTVQWNYSSWRPVNTLWRVVRPAEGLVPDIEVPDVLRAFQELWTELEKCSGGNIRMTQNRVAQE